MLVHRLEAKLHARTYRAAEMTVVGGEDVVGDAGSDVDDEAVLVGFLGEGGCHESEAVGSYFRFVFVIKAKRQFCLAVEDENLDVFELFEAFVHVSADGRDDTFINIGMALQNICQVVGKRVENVIFDYVFVVEDGVFCFGVADIDG